MMKRINGLSRARSSRTGRNWRFKRADLSSDAVLQTSSVRWHSSRKSHFHFCCEGYVSIQSSSPVSLTSMIHCNSRGQYVHNGKQSSMAGLDRLSLFSQIVTWNRPGKTERKINKTKICLPSPSHCTSVPEPHMVCLPSRDIGVFFEQHFETLTRCRRSSFCRLETVSLPFDAAVVETLELQRVRFC